MIHSWQTALYRTLLNERERPQALLLQGRVGLGKTDFALHLSQSWLCEQPSVNGEPCGSCPACRWFEAGQHPDFRRVGIEASESETEKASTQIGVEAVRNLSEFVTLTTHRHGLRIILIEPAEALNIHASNALLKTLEEPAPGTVFLLVSHAVGRLTATLRSRCRNLVFPLPDRKESLSWLERQGVESPELYLALAGGAPLEAKKLYGQDKGMRVSFIRQLADPRLSLVQLSEQCVKISVPEWLGWLQRWVQDLLEQKLAGRSSFHVDLSDLSGRLARNADLYDLLDWERRIREARRLENHPLNPRLLAEWMLAPGLAMR